MPVAAPPPMPGSPSRERLRDGLLVGLVLVLLAMCGGLALTAWTFVGPDEAPSRSLDSSPRPAAAGVDQSRMPTAAPTRTGVGPAGSAPVPSQVTINQARLLLWYGTDRRPAEEFADKAANFGGGFDNTIRPGGSVVGDYALRGSAPEPHPAGARVPAAARRRARTVRRLGRLTR